MNEYEMMHLHEFCHKEVLEEEALEIIKNKFAELGHPHPKEVIKLTCITEHVKTLIENFVQPEDVIIPQPIIDAIFECAKLMQRFNYVWNVMQTKMLQSKMPYFWWQDKMYYDEVTIGLIVSLAKSKKGKMEINSEAFWHTYGMAQRDMENLKYRKLNHEENLF